MSTTSIPPFVPAVAASAPLSGSKPVHSGGKPWLVRARAVIGMIVLIPFAVGSLLVPAYAAPGSLSAIAWDSVGWLLLFAGAGFRLWATLYVGGHKGSRLISQGPYSVCRNPLYFGTFLITLSIAAFVQSPIFAVGVILASSFYLVTTVSFEERLLGERFGEEYVTYCRRVPRFFPRPAGFQTPPMIELDLRPWWIECLRSLRWVTIPIVGQLIAYLRVIS